MYHKFLRYRESARDQGRSLYHRLTFLKPQLYEVRNRGKNETEQKGRVGCLV